MYDFIKKLLDSKSTIILVLLVMVLAWAYTLDRGKKSTIHPASPAGKTLEEIMATPVAYSPETAWDTDFKSAVEATE
jgi:hypothetical protein